MLSLTVLFNSFHAFVVVFDRCVNRYCQQENIIMSQAMLIFIPLRLCRYIHVCTYLLLIPSNAIIFKCVKYVYT